MLEDDCEIEYLDEDEDIVQHCVQNVQAVPVPIVTNMPTPIEWDPGVDIEEQITPLLVERKPAESKQKPTESKRKPSGSKRKLLKDKTEEEDSDYDPTDDLITEYNDLRPPKKKTKRPTRKTQTQKTPSKQSEPRHSGSESKQQSSQSKPKISVIKTAPIKEPPRKVIKKPAVINELEERKKLDIRIPDYEDPLCLPVRGIKRDERDVQKLRHWNNLCLEHFKRSDSPLGVENGTTTASTRTVVLRNVKNKLLGQVETTVWSKTLVENEKGEKKSEVFQCVLPRYREKTIPKSFNLHDGMPHQNFRNTYEVVLTKERQKDGELLVAYKPKEAVSAVYKLIGKKCSEDSDISNAEEVEDCNKKAYIKEVTCCKVCAPCYQTSWRGIRKPAKHENINCRICSRTFVSVYNLLSHLKSHHTHREVQRHRGHISRTLAQVVDYHYKCRICQEQFVSIKLLRKHITNHQGSEIFKCEVGNHMAS